MLPGDQKHPPPPFPPTSEAFAWQISGYFNVMELSFIRHELRNNIGEIYKIELHTSACRMAF